MAKDLFHQAFKEAITKREWSVTDDPLTLNVGVMLTYHVDLAAERFVIAERRKEIIVVEVKSFVGASNTYEFHSALGQYCIYRSALKYLNKPERLLLAVPHQTYLTFFQEPFIQSVLNDYDCQVISFDPIKKIIRHGDV